MELTKIDVANMVTGATPVANGGTGLTSGTTNQFLKFTGSTTLASADDNQGGITVAGQFRITSNQTGDQDPLNAWEESDNATYTRIGSAITQSGGIFSFPSTGIYFLIWDIACNSADGNDASTGWEIYMTTNNSSYTRIARNTESFHAGYNYKNSNTSCMIDVTNTSNDKVKFTVSGTNNVVLTDGNSDTNMTTVTFLRLGDT